MSLRTVEPKRRTIHTQNKQIRRTSVSNSISPNKSSGNPGGQMPNASDCFLSLKIRNRKISLAILSKAGQKYQQNNEALARFSGRRDVVPGLDDSDNDNKNSGDKAKQKYKKDSKNKKHREHMKSHEDARC